jgi:hypothetical protein
VDLLQSMSRMVKQLFWSKDQRLGGQWPVTFERFL